MNRRVIIIIGVVIGVFILLKMMSGPSVKKKKAEQALPQQSEIVLNDAMAVKSSDPDKAIGMFEKVVAGFPQSQEAQKALMEIADIYLKENELQKAQEMCKRLITDYPQASMLKASQQKLWDTNIEMLFSRTVTGDSYVYEVEPGDTLYKIAKKYNTNVDLLMKSNGLEQSLIRPGMKLKIIKSVFSIEVSKSQNKLVLKADGNVVKEYPIGIGDNNSTPVGQFKIKNRIVSPVWYKTGAIIPAGSAENILGSRWMGLSDPGYGIHGTTTDTKEITRQRTQGCVRMCNKDVEELFVIVPVGAEVIIND